MDNHQFYMNQQIREFTEQGSIEFSNENFLHEYEILLKQQNLAYKVVRGLGDYGVTISLCTPKKYPQVANRLNHEINRLEKLLAIKKSAQQTVAAELATPLDPALICSHGTVPANMCYICHPPIR